MPLFVLFVWPLYFVIMFVKKKKVFIYIDLCVLGSYNEAKEQRGHWHDYSYCKMEILLYDEIWTCFTCMVVMSYYCTMYEWCCLIIATTMIAYYCYAIDYVWLWFLCMNANAQSCHVMLILWIADENRTKQYEF